MYSSTRSSHEAWRDVSRASSRWERSSKIASIRYRFEASVDRIAVLIGDLRTDISQVAVGVEQGLKHDSAIHCDELVSLPKSVLTDYVGSLPQPKIAELNRALSVALELHSSETAG